MVVKNQKKWSPGGSQGEAGGRVLEGEIVKQKKKTETPAGCHADRKK